MICVVCRKHIDTNLENYNDCSVSDQFYLFEIFSFFLNFWVGFDDTFKADNHILSFVLRANGINCWMVRNIFSGPHVGIEIEIDEHKKKGDKTNHHHHVVLSARISLTLSRHPSLSSIASSRSIGLHPVSVYREKLRLTTLLEKNESWSHWTFSNNRIFNHSRHFFNISL